MGDRRVRRALLRGAMALGLVGTVVAGTAATPAAAADTLPGEGTWSAGATTPVLQHSAGVAQLQDGRFLLAGGQSDEGYTNRATIYDPVTDEFTEIEPMEIVRLRPAVVTLADGRVAVFGGDVGVTGCFETSSTVEVYDPVSGTWTSLAPYSGNAGTAGAVVLADGRVLIVGAECERKTDAVVWDPATGGYASVPTAEAHLNGALVTLPDGRVMVAGGCCAGDGFDGPVEIFDPATDTWSSVDRLLRHRHFQVANSLVLLDDDRVLAVGGVGWRTSQPDAEIFDVSTGQWRAIDPMPASGQVAAIGLLPDGTVLVRTLQRATFVFDPATESWRTTSNPLSRVGFAHGITIPGGVAFVAGTDFSSLDDDYTIDRYLLGEEPEPTVPGPPTSGFASPCCDGAGMYLQWEPPAPQDEGGRPVLGYEITRVAPDGTETVIFTVSPSHQDQGLTAGGLYRYEIRARNEVGTGEPLVIERITATAPSPVQNLTAAYDGTTLRVDWDPPADDGGVPLLHYFVNRTDVGTGANTSSDAMTDTEFVDADAVLGGTYRYDVYAVNEYGFSSLASIEITAEEPNTPPVAHHAHRTVPPGQPSSILLSGSDPDGGAVAYSIVAAPSHGTLTGTAPSLTYTPDDGYLGPDGLAFAVTDERGATANAVVTIWVDEGGADVVTHPAEPGQEVSTGTDTTPDEPTQAAVVTPTGGEVSIEREAPTSEPPADGYAVVGQPYRIEAPDATPESPLRLTFLVDASALPEGEDETTVVLFRDGVPIEPCADDSGQAIPDPCITERSRDADGTVRLVALSSHASDWVVGVALASTSTVLTGPSTSTYGEQVTVTAVVDGATSGTVSFLDAGHPDVVLAAALVGPTGEAGAVLDGLPIGTHRLVARFDGSPTRGPSTSAELVHVVRAVPTTITADPAVATVQPMLRITIPDLTAHLARADDGAPLAGRTLTFRSGSLVLCQATTDATGTARCTGNGLLALLGLGYTVSFAGDEHHAPSTATGPLVR